MEKPNEKTCRAQHRSIAQAPKLHVAVVTADDEVQRTTPCTLGPSSLSAQRMAKEG